MVMVLKLQQTEVMMNKATHEAVLAAHPYADIFPMMNDEDYQRLVADIAENGQQEAIWLYQGKILDGRNRYKACLDAGVSPEFRQYQGTEPLKFVMSLNLARRHLNSSQCAFVALEVERVLAVEAKERQVEAGTKRLESERNEAGEFVQLKEKIPEAGKEKTEPQARDKAAELVGGTNARYVQDAKKIERDAPELKPLVMAGKLNMPDAVKLASVQSEKRIEAMARINAGEATKNILHSSDSNEWYTPARYAELAHQIMGDIDLDPASCQQANQAIKAKRYFDQVDDGLVRHWSGRVWLNPPYGRLEDGSSQAVWTKKLIEEYRSGRVTEALLLVNAATGNKWFADLWDFPICFVDHRIRFISPVGEKSQPTHSNVIVYFGSNTQGFISIFSSIGVVACRMDRAA